MQVLDNWKIVEEAIKKYAGNKNEEDKKDIRQQIYLDLLAYGRGLTKKKIWWIVKDSVVQYNQGQFQGKCESLSEPSVFRITENQQSRNFDVSIGMDIEQIKEVIEKLPSADQIILKMFFGLAGQPQTISKIAFWFGKPEIWVKRRKRIALKKVRKLLKVEIKNVRS